MRKSILFTVLLSASLLCQAQTGSVYKTYMQKFQRNYVKTHGVVTGRDKQYFRFFPPNAACLIKAVVVPITDTVGISFKTSGTLVKQYYRYALLKFNMLGSEHQLYLYQSKELQQVPAYKDYLFLPFTDATTGDESYGSGRYIDLRLGDIKDNIVVLDFNKAYNPYCAYTSGYNCPIPPKDNALSIAIRAGEKQFAKGIH